MYEPFPQNYVWNLSTNLALAMGGAIGEIDQLVRRIAGSPLKGDEGSSAFFAGWNAMADRAFSLAERDKKAGHGLSAAGKFGRACGYYLTAERMPAHDYSPRKEAYEKVLESFAEHIRLGAKPAKIVTIPYKKSSFPAIFTAAASSNGRPAPCVVFCNGLDSIKEMVYLVGVADQFRARGVSTLIVDQPGVGGALRLSGLTAVIASEVWASAAVDWLSGRSDVDDKRLGMIGWSLGGYYAPRAVAFEKRFRLCVAWGANHEWGLVQQRRLRREGENPVPHYWEHVMWVWGQRELSEFIEHSKDITLTGVVDKIDVPFLIVHGANDRQIPVEYAHLSHRQAVRSPRAELKLFTESEGGVEHCSADNIEPVLSFITDWVADRFSDML
jgi:dienelactone hydrolase